MGTAKLLGACGEARVRQVILKSTLMVYGARPDNPMFLREDHALNGNKKYGYVRDAIQVENYADRWRTGPFHSAVRAWRPCPWMTCVIRAWAT